MKVHGNTIHGQARHSERTATYSVWAAMHARCTLPSQDSYALYGGRGISVCDRWRDFRCFLEDMGERPAGMSIDRIDSNKNYAPENCRWATQKEQQRNRRNNRRIEHAGRCLSAAGWADETGIPSSAIRTRIDRLGWDVARALTEPLVSHEASLQRAKAVQRRAPVEDYIKLLQSEQTCESIAQQYGISSSGVRRAMLKRGYSAAEFTQTTEARRQRAVGKIGGRRA